MSVCFSDKIKHPIDEHQVFDVITQGCSYYNNVISSAIGSFNSNDRFLIIASLMLMAQMQANEDKEAYEAACDVVRFINEKCKVEIKEG